MLGYVFVFSLIVATVAFVTVSGFGSLESARNAEQHNNAERAFDVLNSNIEEVYGNGAPSRATELSLGEASLHTDDPIVFNVTVVDGSDVTTIEREIRPLVFSGIGETKFVYEAGAVFRDQRESGVILEKPPFIFASDRTVIPIIQTTSDGQRSIAGSTVLVRTVAKERTVAVADTDPTSAAFDDVFVNVTNSPRQDLWKRYFEDQVGLSCSVETGPDAVVCHRSGGAPNQVFVTVQRIKIELEK